MNFSKYFIRIVVIVAFLFNTVFTLSATTSSTEIPAIEAEKIKGGPRTIIQNMTDVTVFQPTAANLYLTVVNSKGDIVLKKQTSDLKTTFSTANFPSGTYTIETIDDDEYYQEFTIDIE